MNFTDAIKTSVLNGFNNTDISLGRIVITLVIAFAIAVYVHFVYKLATRRAFYYRNFGTALAIISMITAGIVLAMQSSIVISLGMVGALSIVRFRTAIKDPMDLLFLFWSIGVGIICGAGLFELAIIVSVMASIGILLFEMLPVKNGTFLLCVNASSNSAEDEIMSKVSEMAKWSRIRSENFSADSLDMIIEIKIDAVSRQELVNSLTEISAVESVSLLENSTEIR